MSRVVFAICVVVALTVCGVHQAFAQSASVRVVARALFEGKAMLEIDGRQRLLSVGEASPEGVLLLAASPAGARIRIDGVERDLALDERIDASFARSSEPRRALIAPASDGHYYVDGSINGTALRFVIDTGASTVAINRQDARRIGLLYRVDGTPMMVETASGPARAYRLNLRSVKARAIELTGIEAVVIDGDYPTTALLGQSFLNRLDMAREGVLLELRER
jgi:aspartyl protease family protein